MSQAIANPLRRASAIMCMVMAALIMPAHFTAQAGEAAAASPYANDLTAFFEEVDASYPFFDLKSIRKSWEEAKGRLLSEVADCKSDSEFLGIVVEAIGALHDSHMGLREAKAEVPARPLKYCPGIAFMPATEGRVVVMGASSAHAESLRPGTVVTRIDGRGAREFLEEDAAREWDAGFCSSRQRARLYAYRIALKGSQGDTHTLSYLASGEEKELLITCDLEARGWPHTYNMPPDLAVVKPSFYYGRLPSGAGYMYLRRVDESSETGMRKALNEVTGVTGWIVDLRGNGGGGYDEGLIQALGTIPQPVAVVLDAGCISAGETLARDLQREARARLFGARTAGASSSKRAWTFPSGIATVTMPTRSRWRSDGEPIEHNGIEPDVEVEAVPEEVVAGKNSQILRAEEYFAAVTIDAKGEIVIPESNSVAVPVP